MTSTPIARTRTPLSPMAPLAIATLIAACGGGGGDGGDPRSVSYVPDSSNCLINPDVPGCGLGSSSGGGRTTVDGVALPPAGTIAGPVPAGTAAVEAGPELADVPGSTLYADANNSARLQGPVIGDGTVFNGDLARSIPFTVEAASNDLALLHVRVVPSGSGSEVIGILENRSDELRCFVSLEGLSIRDTEGVRITSEFDSLNLAFVDGTVGQSFFQTGTCIEPDTRVYVSDYVGRPADDIGSFSATHVETGSGSYETTGTRVEPLAYALDGERLEVTVVNRGLIAVNFSFSRVFLLDEAGHPVWTDLVLGGVDELAPGEEGVVTTSVSGFTGQVSSLRIVLDFERASE